MGLTSRDWVAPLGTSRNLHVDTNPETPLPASLPSPQLASFLFPWKPAQHIMWEQNPSLHRLMPTLSRAHPQEGNRIRDAPHPGVGLTTTSAPPHPAALQQGQGGHLHETGETQEEAGG